MGLVLVILSQIISIFTLIMFIRAIVSWFRVDPYNPIIRAMDSIIEPIVGPVRRMLPPMGGIDVSYLVVFIILIAVRQTLDILARGL